jgi:hypothetical protein
MGSARREAATYTNTGKKKGKAIPVTGHVKTHKVVRR